MKNDRGMILVVERNPDVGTLLSALLQDEGYGVVRVSDADGGLEVARQQHPVLICLDDSNREGPGMNLVRALKKDPELQRVPIVVMSPKGTRQPPRATISAEAWIARPYAPQLLVAEVRRVLRSQLAIN